MSPKTILIMRHAEKPDDPTDPDLSEAGFARAESLASWVPSRYPGVNFLFASAISKHSARPYETISPLAKKLGLPLDSTFADQDYAALASELMTAKKYDGTVVLVCWHHGHIPSLAWELKAPAGTYPDPWNPAVFNLALQFDYDSEGIPKVTNIPEPF